MRGGRKAPVSHGKRRGGRIRLAIFASHPIQYNTSLFQALARDERLHPTVFYGCRAGVEIYRDPGFGRSVAWDVPLLDGYQHVFLENRSPRPDPSSFLGLIVPGIRRHWSRDSFDSALLLGWYTLGHLQALRAAWAASIPLIVRGESTLERSPRSQGLRQLHGSMWVPLRRPLYRWVFSRVDSFLTIGSKNEAFYRHFGVPSSKLVRAGYASDNRRFALPLTERNLARAAIRSVLGFDHEATVFLFVGKLAAYKRPFDVLDAFLATTGHAQPTALVFVGDGVLRPGLERRAAASERGDNVRFTGFVNQAELPRWYAAADCLILASDATETWGLVVNEAMAAGLPVIVSSAVGCASDLVRDGENGWIFRSGDSLELAFLLGQFLSLTIETRSLMGFHARESVARWTQESVAKCCADVAERIVG